VLATPHRAFATFAGHYGLRELPLLGAVSGTGQLRPQDLDRLRISLRQEAVPVIFSDQELPGRAIRTISARSGIPLAAAPLAADGVLRGRSLVTTFVHNTCTVVSGLGGRCDRAGGEALAGQWRSIGRGEGIAPQERGGAAPPLRAE
jgi:zinc/manganese transport system substrate-binding protein